MESLIYVDDAGHRYEILSKRRTGHWILYQLDTKVNPWVIRYPDGEMAHFRTEYDMWKFALIDKKLF